MIPLCDIAMLFASRGEDVTIITTPSNAQTLLKRKSINNLLHFNIHTIDISSHFDSDSVQIENVTFATSLDISIRVHFAAMRLCQPVEQLLRENPPDCIVADFMYQWVFEFANTLGILILAFNSLGLFNVCALVSFFSHPELHSDSGSNSFIIPDLPHVITMQARPPTTCRAIEPMIEGGTKILDFL